MSLSLLEGAVQAHIQKLLDEASGPDHTAYIYSVTEDGLVVLVARKPVKFDKNNLFTLTWQEALQIFTQPYTDVQHEFNRRIKERKK